MTLINDIFLRDKYIGTERKMNGLELWNKLRRSVKLLLSFINSLYEAVYVTKVIATYVLNLSIRW